MLLAADWGDLVDRVVRVVRVVRAEVLDAPRPAGFLGVAFRLALAAVPPLLARDCVREPEVVPLRVVFFGGFFLAGMCVSPFVVRLRGGRPVRSAAGCAAR